MFGLPIVIETISSEDIVEEILLINALFLNIRVEFILRITFIFHRLWEI